MRIRTSSERKDAHGAATSELRRVGTSAHRARDPECWPSDPYADPLPRAGANAWLPAASSCRSITETGLRSRGSALTPAAYGGVSCRSAEPSPRAHTSTTTVMATSRATGPITRRTSIRTTSIRRTMDASLRTTRGIPTRASTDDYASKRPPRYVPHPFDHTCFRPRKDDYKPPVTCDGRRRRRPVHPQGSPHR